MAEQYRILNAMLLAPEFTPAELAERTGANRQTVYSVLRRYRPYLEAGERRQPGKRGGVTKPKKLTPTGRELVRRELSSLPGLTVAGPERESVPAPILAAEEVLLKRLPASEPGGHSRALSLARSLAADGILEAQEKGVSEVEPTKAHLDLTRFLVKLAANDAPELERDPTSAIALHREFNSVTSSLRAVGEWELIAEANERLQQSPVYPLMERVSEAIERAMLSAQRVWMLDAVGDDRLIPCIRTWSEEHSIEVEEIEAGAIRTLTYNQGESVQVSVVVTVNGGSGDWRGALESVRVLGPSAKFAVIAEEPSEAMVNFVAHDMPGCTFVSVAYPSPAGLRMAVGSAISGLVGQTLVAGVDW